MWKIIGILFSGVLISILEVPALVKEKSWREITVFFIILGVGLTLTILLTKNVPIPTPVDWIVKIYRPIAAFFEQILA